MKISTFLKLLTALPLVAADLYYMGDNGSPSQYYPLHECEADCDRDSDCAGSLKCFQRDGREAVPGCSSQGEGRSGKDYCYDPDNGSSFKLTSVGDGGRPSNKFPLGKCEGDCDSSSECARGLRCFQRHDFESVPGCSGSGTRGVDYCYDPDDGSEQLPDIVDTAITAGFDTLVAAVSAAGLVDTLRSPGPFTVFAPTDDAFAALPRGLLEDLLDDTDALTSILLYHVVSGVITAQDAIDAAPADIETVNGADVRVRFRNGKVLINDAEVIVTDVFASNGVIHVIDMVLIPPQDTKDPEELDIVDTAIDAGFDTLVAAVSAAGLVDTLRGRGPFTVFAPTDDAFADLPDGVLEDLLDDTDALTDILLYHVVSGLITADDAFRAAPAEIATVNGADISVRVRNGNLRINDSFVIVADVFASNGVIHVIDRVLIPPEDTSMKALKYVGDDGHFDKFPLGACEGDCDSDSDCDRGLECFKRQDSSTVHGCSGRGEYGMDYCYDPSY